MICKTSFMIPTCPIFSVPPDWIDAKLEQLLCDIYYQDINEKINWDDIVFEYGHIPEVQILMIRSDNICDNELYYHLKHEVLSDDCIIEILKRDFSRKIIAFEFYDKILKQTNGPDIVNMVIKKEHTLNHLFENNVPENFEDPRPIGVFACEYFCTRNDLTPLRFSLQHSNSFNLSQMEGLLQSGYFSANDCAVIANNTKFPNYIRELAYKTDCDILSVLNVTKEMIADIMPSFMETIFTSKEQYCSDIVNINKCLKHIIDMYDADCMKDYELDICMKIVTYCNPYSIKKDWMASSTKGLMIDLLLLIAENTRNADIQKYLLENCWDKSNVLRNRNLSEENAAFACSILVDADIGFNVSNVDVTTFLQNNLISDDLFKKIIKSRNYNYLVALSMNLHLKELQIKKLSKHFYSDVKFLCMINQLIHKNALSNNDWFNKEDREKFIDNAKWFLTMLASKRSGSLYLSKNKFLCAPTENVDLFIKEAKQIYQKQWNRRSRGMFKKFINEHIEIYRKHYAMYECEKEGLLTFNSFTNQYYLSKDFFCNSLRENDSKTILHLLCCLSYDYITSLREKCENFLLVKSSDYEIKKVDFLLYKSLYDKLRAEINQHLNSL